LTQSNVLFFAFANCKHRRRNFAAYREHHSRSKGRDCEIESGSPVVGGYTYNTYKGAESGTKKHGTTETHNVGGGQETNRSGTAGTVGKNQGSKEGVVRYIESAERPLYAFLRHWRTNIRSCQNRSQQSR
jgi:hypothetical protein